MDSSRLAIVSDSVGGNMAAAVTLLAKNEVDLRSIFKHFPIQLIQLLTKLIWMASSTS